MSKTFLRLSFFLIFLNSNCKFANAQSIVQHWSGYEIIGNHSVDRKDIENAFPLVMGSIYQYDQAGWQKSCEAIKNKFQFYFTHCAALRYVNGETYMVIDVVEKGQEYRATFRKPPSDHIDLVNAQVKTVFDNLYDRMWPLFNQGNYSPESGAHHYLDYDDPVMHNFVLTLKDQVPPFRDNILDVLKNDQDVNKREDAANFLNWTVNQLEGTIHQANALLNDPADGVRNNISRFTWHFMDQLQSEAIRRDVIDQLVLQLDRPSHGDRNKALYNLLEVVKDFPGEAEYISKNGLKLIAYLSENSVLENVRDPARMLKTLLDDRL